MNAPRPAGCQACGYPVGECQDAKGDGALCASRQRVDPIASPASNATQAPEAESASRVLLAHLVDYIYLSGAAIVIAGLTSIVFR